MLKKTKLLTTLLLSFVINQAFAQFEISKYSINSGGAITAGSTYQITVSIGQADANLQLTNDDFSVASGFWSAELGNANDLIFINSFED